MPKFRISFDEVVRYTAELEATPEQMDAIQDGDDSLLVELLDQQYDHWVTGEGVQLTVSNRNVVDVEEVKEN